MRMLEKLRMRFAMLFHRGRAGAHLDAELQFHLDQEIAENIAAGMSPEEARYAAMRSFGNATTLREQARETWHWGWLESLLQDVRFALRQLWRSPGFVVITVLTLMLGIGANTAIFTLMNALLLKSLPVPEPDQLVRIALNLDIPDATAQNQPLNFHMIQSLAQRSHSFSGIFGWSEYGADLKEGDSKHSYTGALVSGNAFDVLGVRPALGRLLTVADDQKGGGPDGWAVVISHQFWVEHYHSDPSVIGHHVTLNGYSVIIVGVAPANFEGIIVTARPDFYMPLEYEPVMRQSFNDSMLHRRDNLWLTAMARMKPGVTLKQASVEVLTLSRHIKEDTLPPQSLKLTVVQGAKIVALSGRSGWSFLRVVYTRPLLLIQMLVAAVLLICCANLAGLGLARASARQHEFALRVALGAARSRMLRQMLVESFLLAIPGALLGLGFAWAACRMLLHFMTDHAAAEALSTRPDVLVLSVTAGCAVLCALLFGIAPAWIASRAAPEPALRRATRGATRNEKGRLRQSFVCLQIALTLTLVVMAGLLSATLISLRNSHTGFRTENVLFALTDLRTRPEKGANLTQLYWRMARRMEEMPGVDAVSVVMNPPLHGSPGSDFSAVNGKIVGAKQGAAFNQVDAHFFSALGVRILAGHDFTNSDADAHACILSRLAASAFFQHTSAIGGVLREYQFTMNTGQSTTKDCDVIGIVEDAQLVDPHQAVKPTVYYPIREDVSDSNSALLTFVIHARSIAEGKDAYRKMLHELTPDISPVDPIPFTVQLDDSLSIERMLASLSGFFAGLALLLSGIGIYGLIAWTVTQRTMEFGVRMALGSTRVGILLLVLRQIAVLILIGILAGGVAAFFSARSMHGFLFGVAPGSPGIFVSAACILCVIALFAALVPTRRAVSIHPVEALREE
jgi:predicted permease